MVFSSASSAPASRSRPVVRGPKEAEGVFVERHCLLAQRVVGRGRRGCGGMTDRGGDVAREAPQPATGRRGRRGLHRRGHRSGSGPGSGSGVNASCAAIAASVPTIASPLRCSAVALLLATAAALPTAVDGV